MKLTVYFRMLVAVLLLGGPIMAGAIPDTQLTAAEKQCCKEMSGDCGQDASSMPMSHSCCKTSVQPPHDFRPSSSFSAPAPYSVISAIEFLPAPFLVGQSGQFTPWLSRALSPPLATLDALAPLTT